MRSLVARRPLLCFFALAYLLSWWAVPLGGFLPCGPLLAALVVVGCLDGRAGLRALGRRMLPRRDALGTYAIAVVLPLAVAGVAIAATLGLGTPFGALHGIGPWWAVIGLGALRLIDPLDGPLGEEPGWRGFALPRLLRDHSPAVASLLLGVVVAGWHLPLVVLPGEDLPVPFLLATVAVTFVYTWLWLRSGGNVFATMLAHAAEGTIKLGALGLVGVASTRLTLAYTAAWVIVATTLVLADRRMWFAKSRRTPVGAPIAAAA